MVDVRVGFVQSLDVLTEAGVFAKSRTLIIVRLGELTVHFTDQSRIDTPLLGPPTLIPRIGLVVGANVPAGRTARSTSKPAGLVVGAPAIPPMMAGVPAAAAVGEPTSLPAAALKPTAFEETTIVTTPSGNRASTAD